MLLAAIAIANIFYLIGLAALASAMRVQICEIKFGVGPTLGVLPLGTVRLLIKLMPIAGSLTFVSSGAAEVREGLEAQLPRGRRVALMLSGCASCFVASLILLGPGAGLRETLSSFRQIFSVFWTHPNMLWQPIIAAAQANQFAVLLGLTCAKMAGLNLLPLPPLSGGMALYNVIGIEGDEGSLPSIAQVMLKLSVFVLLVILLAWFISWVVFALQS